MTVIDKVYYLLLAPDTSVNDCKHCMYLANKDLKESY